MPEMNFSNVNIASAVRRIGVLHIETEDDLFVQQMQLAQENSIDAYEYAHEAHDKKLDAAVQTAVAEGVQAGASIAAGTTSLAGGVRMNQQRKASVDQQLVVTKPKQAGVEAPANERASVSLQRGSSANNQSSKPLLENDSAHVKDQSSKPLLENDSAQQDAPQSDNEQDAVVVNQARVNAEESGNEAATQQTQVAVGGSEDFKKQFNSLENRIGRLQEQKARLGETTITDGAAQKKLSDVTEADCNTWRTRRDELRSQDALGPDGQDELAALDENIGQYESYKKIDTDIDDCRNKQTALVTSERQTIVTSTQMQTGVMQMKYSGLADMARGVMGIIAAPIKAEATATQVEADRKTTESEWCKERGSAARQLAEKFMGNISSIESSIKEVSQTTQGVIQKLSNVQA